MLRPWVLLAIVLLALPGLLVPLAPPARAEDGEAEAGATAPVETELARLGHVLLHVRTAAEARLAARLPEVGPTLRAHLPSASLRAQPHLLRLLLASGDVASIDAMLDALPRLPWPSAFQLQRTIAESLPLATAAWPRVVERLEGKQLTGQARKQMEGFRSLLRRAEIEDRLLAHRSETGGTGYYKGQYANMVPFGQEGREVLLAIAGNRGPAELGEARSGPYRFVRGIVHEYEVVRGMALNALADTCKPEHTLALLKLEVLHANFMKEAVLARNRARRYMYPQMVEDAPQEPAAIERLQEDLQDEAELRFSLWGDVTATLYVIDKENPKYDANRAFWERSIASPLWQEVLRYYWRHTLASFQIRTEQFRKAVQTYQQLAYGSSLGRATSFYNLACAYASWSRRLDGVLKESRIRMALDALERAVDQGWADIGWMDQDGDLDPIRESPRYKQLKERIRKEHLALDED